MTYDDVSFIILTDIKYSEIENIQIYIRKAIDNILQAHYLKQV